MVKKIKVKDMIINKKIEKWRHRERLARVGQRIYSRFGFIHC